MQKSWTCTTHVATPLPILTLLLNSTLFPSPFSSLPPSSSLPSSCTKETIERNENIFTVKSFFLNLTDLDRPQSDAINLIKLFLFYFFSTEFLSMFFQSRMNMSVTDERQGNCLNNLKRSEIIDWISYYTESVNNLLTLKTQLNW